MKDKNQTEQIGFIVQFEALDRKVFTYFIYLQNPSSVSIHPLTRCTDVSSPCRLASIWGLGTTVFLIPSVSRKPLATVQFVA